MEKISSIFGSSPRVHTDEGPKGYQLTSSQARANQFRAAQEAAAVAAGSDKVNISANAKQIAAIEEPMQQPALAERTAALEMMQENLGGEMRALPEMSAPRFLNKYA